MELFTDAPFPNTHDHKSQLWFVLLLIDDHDNCNIEHFGSSRCKCVVRSVLSAELHALTFGFDSAFYLRELASEITGKRMPLEVYVDSKTLSDLVAKEASIVEKRLQIGSFGVRQSFTNG